MFGFTNSGISAHPTLLLENCLSKGNSKYVQKNSMTSSQGDSCISYFKLTDISETGSNSMGTQHLVPGVKLLGHEANAKSMAVEL
jgi:hypothetical protein